MNSKWYKWLSQPGNIRAVSIDATELMRELCGLHSFNTELSQSGFSEAVVGALLVASSHKAGESINVNAQGSGFFKQAIIDASPEGKVRGFMLEQTDPSMRTFGIEGNAGPWGTGILSVLYTKSLEGKVPYTGMVPISTGILDDAFNEYYKDSAQTISKVGVSIEVKDDKLTWAHGALIQTLGGASQEEIDLVSKISAKQMRSLGANANDPEKFKQALKQVTHGKDFRQVEESDIISFCTCNQDRIERALILAGEQDMVEALGEEPTLDVSCDFCRKEYKVSAERLKSLYKKDRTQLQ